MRFLAGGRGHTYCSETCEEQSKKSSGKMAGRRSSAQISSPYSKKLIGAAIVHAGPSVEKRESWKTMKPAELPGACRDMRGCSIHSSGCLVSLRHKKDKTATSKIQSNRNFSLPSASSIQVGVVPCRRLNQGARMTHNVKYFAITLMLFVALSFTFERQAHAYVDPGSGLLIFQGISAVFSGALFYFRRRLKNLFVKTPKGIPQSSRPL